MHRLIAFCLLAVIVAACAASSPRITDNTARAPDSVQPSPLAAMTLEELNQRGQQLMAAKSWGEAIPFFEQAAKLTVDPHDEYYNLACCHARLGDPARAMEFLQRAYETGVNNYPYVEADADLESLKGHKPFDDFMAEFKQAYDAARAAEGAVLLVETPGMSEVRVRLPQNYDKSQRYPLVIGLHEYGANARGFAPIYDRICYKRDFIFVAVDGPYSVPVADENPGGRWWWLYDAPDDGWMRTRATTVQLVLNVRQRMIADYPIDERNIYLLGHRQGGTAAMLVCATEWSKFAGFITIGAHHLGDDPRVDRKFDCLLCHSRDDEKLSFDACATANRIWTAGGAKVTVEERVEWEEIGDTCASAITWWLGDRIDENSDE